MNHQNLFKTLSLTASVLILSACVQTMPVVASASATAQPTQQPAVVRQVTPAGATSAQARITGWNGLWIGTMECGNGSVRLELNLTPQSATTAAVMGKVLTVGGKPVTGNFRMRGILDGSRINFRWQEWVGTPLSDRPMNFDGDYQAGVESLSLRPLDNACRAFVMRRVQPSDLEAAQKLTTQATQKTASVTPAGIQPVSEATLTYADVISVMRSAKGNSQAAAKRLVGKRLQVTLRATGPDSLMVNPKDLVFFTCEQRSQGFKGGLLIATIVKFEDDMDGNPMVRLDRCGR